MAATTETARLALLKSLALLDTRSEPEFDAIAREAVLLTGYDTALVTLLDADRCWFKASAGILAAPGMPREVPRGLTYCQHALGSSGFFVVRDGLSDPRVAQLATVRDPAGFRAYAGIQLILPEGLSVGSLCVLNRSPRTPAADDHATLQRLADRALQLIAARRFRGDNASAARDTLLIVDDDDTIQTFLANLFERRGVRTLVARDGIEALRLYRETPGRIAVVLTDFNMPEVNGLAVVRALNAEPNPPVSMVMSGYLGASDRRDLTAAGARMIINKPLCFRDLGIIKDAICAVAKP